MVIDARDRRGRTVAHLFNIQQNEHTAVSPQSFKGINWLLSRDIGIENKRRKDFNFYLLVAFQQALRCLEELLNLSHDVLLDVKDLDGFTPKEVIAQNPDNKNLIKYLEEREEEKNELKSSDKNPLLSNLFRLQFCSDTHIGMFYV